MGANARAEVQSGEVLGQKTSCEGERLVERCNHCSGFHAQRPNSTGNFVCPNPHGLVTCILPRSHPSHPIITSSILTTFGDNWCKAAVGHANEPHTLRSC